MEIVFLGSSNAFADQGYWNSILVNGTILLDASPIVLPHLKKLNINPADIEFIFITHFHGDHVGGLPFLFLEYFFKVRRKKHFVIVGPKELKETVEKINELFFPVLSMERPFKAQYLEVEEGEHEINGLHFKALKMKHGEGVSLGYRIQVSGRVVAYTGDTELFRGVYELAEGADVIIVETSSSNTRVPGHMNMDDLRELRERTPPNLKIIATHLGACKETVNGVLLAKDFLKVNI